MADAVQEARRPRTLFGVLLFFLALRAIHLAAGADVFFYAEELEKGTAAKALLDGVDVPWYRLPFHPYEGGGLVVAVLKAGAFLLVGESLLAHKLVALFTSALVLWAGWTLTRRHFGPRAALVFGLLFVLAPRAFQKLSLLSLGIHFEALAFVFVVLDRGLVLLRAERPRDRDLVVLGLAVGFGTYFSYQVAIAGVFVALAALVARPRLALPRTSLPALAACALGLTPWFLMWHHVGAELFDVHGQGLVSGGDGAGAALSSFVRSTGALPTSDLLLFWLFPACALVGAVGLALRGEVEERRGLLFLTCFAATWTAAWLASGFVYPAYHTFLGVQRLAPLWGVASVGIAAAVARGWDRGGGARAGAAALCALLLGAGIVHAVAIGAEGRPREALANLAFLARTKGLDYRGYFSKVLPRQGAPGEEGLVERARPWLALEEEARELLLGDLTAVCFARDRRGLEHVGNFAAALVPGEEEACLLGAGEMIVRASGGDLERALAWTNAVEPPRRRDLLLEALGRVGVRRRFPEDIEDELPRVLGQPGAGPYLAGVGHDVYRRFVLGTYGVAGMAVKPAGALEWIATLPAEARPHLVAGFERARAEYDLGGATIPPR